MKNTYSISFLLMAILGLSFALSYAQNPEGERKILIFGGGGASGGASAFGSYRFNTATTGDPGTGRVLLNNVVQANATQIHISKTSDNGVAVGNFLLSLGNGSRIFMQIEGDDAAYVLALVTADAVDVTTYATLAITVEDTGNALTNNAKLIVGITGIGSGGVSSFTSGSVIFAGADGHAAEDNTNLFWDNTSKRLGVGTNTPQSPFEVVGDSPGVLGGSAAGALIIRSASTAVNANAVITGYGSFGGFKPLWYLGSSSSSNDHTILTNRQPGSFFFGTNDITRMTIEAAGRVVFENNIQIKGGTPSIGDVLTAQDTVGNYLPQAPAVTSVSGATGAVVDGDIDHDGLLNFAISKHRVINDSSTSTIELFSADKILALTSTAALGVTVLASADASDEGLGAITLSGLGASPLNGVTLVDGVTRVIITEQGGDPFTADVDNGLYVVSTGAWTRATDLDSDSELHNGVFITIEDSSSTHFRHRHVVTTVDPITVGVTAFIFSEFSAINFGTTSGTNAEGNDSRIPIQDENDALIGTNGTPSAANKYVTNSDSRNSDARTPTTHAATHTNGTDDIPDATSGQKGLATSTQITKLDAITGTNTGDQTITLTGDITGSGTGSFVTTVSANVIGLTELAPGTDGNLYTFNSSGDPDFVVTGCATHVLTSNGVGTAPTFQVVSSPAVAYTKIGATCFETNNAQTTGCGHFGLMYNKATGGVRVMQSADEAFAEPPVAAGLIIRTVDIYASANLALEVWEKDITDGTKVSKGTGTTNTQLNVTDFTITSTNAVLIEVVTTTGLQTIYGGTINH